MDTHDIEMTVQKMKLADGDILVLKSPSALSHIACQNIIGTMKGILNDMKVEAQVIILDEGMDVSILSKFAGETNSTDAIVQASGDTCTLADCPPGAFLYSGILGFKTEYGAMISKDLGGSKVEWSVSNYPEVYVIASGESFWAGAKGHEARSQLVVQPIEITIDLPNMFGKKRGRFDEESARKAQRSLQDTLINTFFAIPPDQIGAAVAAFNDAHKARSGHAGWKIVEAA